jgi:CRISPR type I-E-associated protein CasB/Cse2
MLPPNRDDWIGPFIGRLKSLMSTTGRGMDRATLSRLRRGLGKPIDATLAESGWLFADVPDRPQQALYNACLVAGLFGLLHQGADKVDESPPRNLGASLYDLADKERSRRNPKPKPDEPVDTAERRLATLLRSHRDDLPSHLRQTVSLLKSRGVTIDWSGLLRDLMAWDHPDRYVQRKWARAYWTPNRTENATATSDEAA